MVAKRLGKIAIGCLGILVILVILGLIFSGVIIKKIISGVVQQKTGIVVQTNMGSSPGVSYTDPKTGATLNLGGNKIPDSFPKDFPIYPSSTVTTSASQTGGSSGLWLTLTTSDSIDEVNNYYESNLKTNGWTANSNGSSDSTTTWILSKGNLSGSLLVQRKPNDSKTSIIIVIGVASPNP